MNLSSAQGTSPFPTKHRSTHKYWQNPDIQPKSPSDDETKSPKDESWTTNISPLNKSKFYFPIKAKLYQWCEHSYKDKNVLLLEGDKYKAHLYASIIVATLVMTPI